MILNFFRSFWSFATIHIPTSLRFCILFCEYALVSSHPSLSFCFLSHYLHRSMSDEFLGRDINGNSIPKLQTLFCKHRKIHLHWNGQFFLTSRCDKALNYAPCFLVVRHDHVLKIGRSVMSSLEFLHLGIKLRSCVQSCWHVLTNWIGIKLALINSNGWIADIWWVPNKSFVHNCFLA